MIGLRFLRAWILGGNFLWQ